MEPLYWLIAVGVFIIIEVITLGLTTIWFAGGAFVAFVASVVPGTPVWLQAVLFLAVSIVLLLFTRPVVEKRINNSRVKTNVDEMEGKCGKVIVKIDNFEQSGMVLLSGMEWTARSSQDDEIIPVGAEIEVLSVEGAHVVVKQKKS